MEAHHPHQHQHQHHPESEPVRTKTQPLQEVIHRRTPGARLWLIKEASSIPALSWVLLKSSTGSRLWLKASRLEPNLPARWSWNSEPSRRQWRPIWTPLTWQTCPLPMCFSGHSGKDGLLQDEFIRIAKQCDSFTKEFTTQKNYVLHGTNIGKKRKSHQSEINKLYLLGK